MAKLEEASREASRVASVEVQQAARRDELSVELGQAHAEARNAMQDLSDADYQIQIYKGGNINTQAQLRQEREEANQRLINAQKKFSDIQEAIRFSHLTLD